MARFGNAPGPAGARRRIATAFAAAGALLLSSGMVMAAAPGAVAAPKDDKPGAAANPNKGNGNNNAGGNQGGNGNGGNQGGNGNGGNQGGNGNGGNQGGNGNGGNNGGGATKFYVCKWVGQVAAGDQAHHIVPVSGSPIGGEGWFNDQQGPSYVLELEEGEEPSLADCPAYSGDRGDTASLVTLDWAANDCSTDGYVREPVSANVQYMIDGGENWAVDEGAHVVTATITNAATEFTGSSAGWTVTGTTATRTIDLLTDEECTGLDVSVIRIAKCGEWGSIVAGPTTGVAYTSSAGKWTGLEGDVTVTATVTHNKYKLPGSLSGWAVAEDRRSATRTYSLGSYSTCSSGGGDSDVDATLVSPRYPSTTDATCSRNGRLVVPNQPQGVRMERTGSVPGTVTFSFSPAEGYAFPEGTDREVSLRVAAQLTGGDCIKGVATVRPNPQPGNVPAAGPVNSGTDAEVLGEQAVAVPTAVAAGLGDTMTAATTTGSPQLAQALVAGGLLMLVAGGATGLGRRTRGAHES